MIKRTIYFGNPVYLSLRNAQLQIRLPEVENNDTLPELFKKNAVTTIPVEDIGIVVLDHKQVTITQALMEALLQNNAVVITCDSTHHPTGLLMPLSGNTIQSERFKAQLAASEPLKKQLWAQTVSQKIKNQYAVLCKQGVDANYLTTLYKSVKSGDSDNCEASAAAYYWQRVFPSIPNFKRAREGTPPNHYLNYGYAILRATMARSIVAAGLLPTLGIHHSNRYNAYCLADDLMEPYRPYIDEMVCHIVKTSETAAELSKEMKAYFLKVPAIDVMLDGEKSPLMNATQRTAVSLVKCFNGEQRKMLYPELI
ncbi:MAG: type II CRISPR-associated endonuclease Cas1 [Chitinophagales bacterium]|nr:type II CRISPR-associated endonuclease Cas1 [Chitinophagales bacterium]